MQVTSPPSDSTYMWSITNTHKVLKDMEQVSTIVRM